MDRMHLQIMPKVVQERFRKWAKEMDSWIVRLNAAREMTGSDQDGTGSAAALLSLPSHNWTCDDRKGMEMRCDQVRERGERHQVLPSHCAFRLVGV